MKIKYTCPVCKNQFLEYKSQITGKRAFCSSKCRAKGIEVDLTGQIVGRLTVMSRIRNETKRQTYYSCVCSCGKEKIVTHNNLASRSTQSCGCLQKELVAKRSRKPKGVAILGMVWRYYQKNARTRGFTWNLSKEEFNALVLMPCTYCGVSGRTTTQTEYGDELRHNGVDRRDNTIGYVLDNCQPCCSICNRAKGSLPEEEFQKWIEAILQKKRSLLPIST